MSKKSKNKFQHKNKAIKKHDINIDNNKSKLKHKFNAKYVLLSIGVFLLINLAFFPANKFAINHDIAYNPNFNLSPYSLKKNIESKKPEIILLGNSMLGRGVHEGYLNYLTKKNTIIITNGGSATAWWYLALKNVITKTNSKPKLLVIFFRDNFLSIPDFRVNGEYKDFIDVLANRNEPILDQKAYFNKIGKIEFFLKSYWPLYQKKDKFIEKLDKTIKSTSANLLNKNYDYAENIIDSVFADSNLVQEILTLTQQKAEKTTKSKEIDFNTSINKSFLPNIIELAKQNNIQLTFVRVKKRRDIEKNMQPEFIIEYMKNLKKYLKTRNIELFDFSDDERLTLAHYSDGDHMNDSLGIKTFTEILSPIIDSEFEKLSK